ncbi:MAG: hypothetical protein IM537_14930, partial [Pseudanabaena sp. M57BS1SP1A06MG]|nr:hypothetical protein [Pseudanabaena sp. M57BS1SP1A06MG]
NKYRFIWSQILRKHGNTKVVKSHWVLITKDVIEVSRNKSYADQKKLIANLARETGIDYEIPSVLDAAIFMFAYSIFFSRVYNEHISSDSMFTKYSHSDDSEFTPTNDPRIYTRCREKAKNYRITVGGLSRGGLSVDCLIIDRNNIGVAPIRKFSQ